MDEIGLRDTVDPLAGSFFVETLTKQMEEKIQEEQKKIRDVGGMIEAEPSYEVLWAVSASRIKSHFFCETVPFLINLFQCADHI